MAVTEADSTGFSVRFAFDHPESQAARVDVVDGGLLPVGRSVSVNEVGCCDICKRRLGYRISGPCPIHAPTAPKMDGA